LRVDSPLPGVALFFSFISAYLLRKEIITSQVTGIDTQALLFQSQENLSTKLFFLSSSMGSRMNIWRTVTSMIL